MRKHIKILLTGFTAIFILLGFAVPVNMVGNWYQQFMPTGLPNFQLSDIYFLDSLTGWAVTGNSSPNDSSGYILKTTNGGDNWILKFAEYRDFSRVKFINNNTGFVSGGYFNGARLYKSTNGGNNWFPLNTPGGGQIFFDDMFVLDENTIWVAASNSLVGGVFLTTNGGLNWTPQFSGGNQNPNKIYMYNARIGFMSNNSASPNIYKTTNGGASWSILIPGDYFFKIQFIDSLTGWRTRGDTMKYTTNSGINWTVQLMPYGGMIFSNNMTNFTILNRDTLWGCGGYILFPNTQVKNILYRTTNHGINWQFQIPDTSLIPASYAHIQFIDKFKGWVYGIQPRGLHTTTGGGDTFLTGIQQINNEVPKEFKLYQNFPNPFNPITNIRYSLTVTGKVSLKIFDINGKEVSFINKEQEAGTYQYSFDGSNLSSGVYFYKIIVQTKKEIFSSTRKMILIK